MQKFIFRVLPVLALFGATLLSCSDDDDKSLPGSYEAPSHKVTVENVQRTQTTFTIEAPQASDYAYIIAEKGETPVTDAEELFKSGTVGQLEDGKVSATSYDSEGAKDYVVYTAVRRINPYVYSEVIATDLSTNIPYTDLITLDKVGLTDVSYHIEMPEGATRVRHLIEKEADFMAIKNIVGSLGEINEMLFCKVFGITSTETSDFYFDKLSVYADDNHSILHTGTAYLAMAGVVGDDGEIIPETFQCVRFETRKADECPYNIDYAVTTTSTQAIVSVIPDPEIVEYRLLVESRSEFDYALAEGEAQMRNLVVGFWDDNENSPKRVHSGTIEYKALGLIPNSEYVLGIVGYDAQRREKWIRYDFITGEPTGPKPTLTLTEEEPEVVAPWSTRAFNVKGTNLSEVRYGFFIKSQIDQLLSNGSTLTNIVRANGDVCSDATVQGILSNEGVVFETDGLTPQTEYMFAVYARNEEYVTTVATAVFTTDEAPVIGGSVRKNMPGKYIASTTIDEDGTTVTFPVTIATGYDAMTTAEYSNLNRLVCLGFGPESDCPFSAPADLVNAGLSMDDAYKYYGPKWFIEFKSDTEIQVPAPDPSYGKNYTWFMGYNTATSKSQVLWGYGISNRNGREMNRAGDSFPVEVSADGKTITVNGAYLAAQDLYYYPCLVTPPTGWGNPTTHFRCYSPLVLTKQEDANSARMLKKSLIAPRIISGHVGSTSIKAGRTETASKLK